MRILVITRAPWRNDNNIGNSLCDFFGDLKDFEFYSLCMRSQKPNNGIAIKNFCISEMQIINNVLKGTPIGIESMEQTSTNESFSEDKIYAQAKKKPLVILSFLREIVWQIGRWKNKNLIEYLDEVSPDIVFMPVFNCFYPHKILNFIAKHTNAKIVLFHADDNYTLKQFSLSPLYWLYRFNLRKWVKRSTKLASLNYAISDLQIKDYKKSLNTDFKLLTKFSDFSTEPQLKSKYNDPLRLVFTGNISCNRWKSLSLIADTLKKINKEREKAHLYIYTTTPVTKSMKQQLNIEGASSIVGAVSGSEVSAIQRDADILVHAEGMDFKSKLAVRQSFSTKIVDYLKSARPILAVGPKNIASISYFLKNDCALVADNKAELKTILNNVINDHEKLTELAELGYSCGVKYHSKDKMEKMLRDDFLKIIGGNR